MSAGMALGQTPDLATTSRFALSPISRPLVSKASQVAVAPRISPMAIDAAASYIALPVICTAITVRSFARFMP